MGKSVIGQKSNMEQVEKAGDVEVNCTYDEIGWNRMRFETKDPGQVMGFLCCRMIYPIIQISRIERHGGFAP